MEVAMSLWGRFGEEIARTEDAMLGGSDRIERVRGRLLATTARTAAGLATGAGRPRALAFGLAAAAVVALGVSAAIFAARDPGAIEATVGDERRSLRAGEWVAAPADAARRIDFSDGSSVSLEPRSGARVVALGADGARVSLERGTARVAVQRRKGARWQVDVGPYEVSVKGTRFVVGWDPEAQLFTLTLGEGSVLVRGPLLDQGRTIAVDETVLVSVAEGRLEILRGGDATAGDEAASGAATTAAAGTAVERRGPEDEAAGRCTPADVPNRAPAAPRPVENWRDLARAGRYETAIAAAERQGADAIVRSATAADLLLLGDAARLSRKYDLADQSYLAIRARHPSSAESVSAAFALGRLAFDHQHLYVKAAKWLDVYLTEGGEGAALAREALGRLMEAMERAGDPDGAKGAATRYLARYPQGPQAAAARRILSAQDAPPPAAP
jgi:ferric-dicitrate binding protein FerR (iron transport regulator)